MGIEKWMISNLSQSILSIATTLLRLGNISWDKEEFVGMLRKQRKNKAVTEADQKKENSFSKSR